MWYPKDNNDSSNCNSNNNRNNRKEISLSRETRAKPIWEYYTDDYISNWLGILKKEFKPVVFELQFNFKKSENRPNISVKEEIPFYNFQQFKAVLKYYSSKEFLTLDAYASRWEDYPVGNSNLDLENEDLKERTSYYSQYGNLCNDIIYRDILQRDIEGILYQESRYIIFNLEEIGNKLFLRYDDLNERTLSSAIRHFELIIHTFKIWSYHYSEDGLEMDRFMIHVLTQCNRKRELFNSYKSFWTYYIDDLLYEKKDLPLTMLRINLDFHIKWKRILHIKSIEQFRAIINHYGHHCNFIPPLRLSSKYKDTYDDVEYRSTLQSRIDKVFKQMGSKFVFSAFFKYEDDLLNLNFYDTISTDVIFCKYLELIFTIFRTWNDDTNDKDAMYLFTMAMRDKLLPLQKISGNNNMGFEDSITLYQKYEFVPLTLNINLQIVSRESEHKVSRIVHLKEPQIFEEILNYFNSLPNWYLLFEHYASNDSVTQWPEFDNFLFLFVQGDNDLSSVIDLYYYPKSSDLGISLIIKHLEFVGMVLKKYLRSKEDEGTFDRYLSSVTDELRSIDDTTTNALLYTSLSNGTFQYPSNLSTTTSSLTLHLRLLPLDKLNFKDTLNFRDTSRFLSILDHYSLIPNDFLPNTDNSVKIRRQRVIDNRLLKLSENIFFYFEKFDNESTYYLTYSELESKDVHSALVHLELMIKVFNNWSDDIQGKGVLDGFVGKARKVLIHGLTEDSSRNDNEIPTIIGLPNDEDATNVQGSLMPKALSLPGDMNLMEDNRPEDTFYNLPNLPKVNNTDISMMEDVD